MSRVRWSTYETCYMKAIDQLIRLHGERIACVNMGNGCKIKKFWIQCTSYLKAKDELIHTNKLRRFVSFKCSLNITV